MGCCTSSIAWEADEADATWPTYTIRRTLHSASHFSLSIVPNSTTTTTAAAAALEVEVNLFLTSSGRLHAGSLHPSEVTFTLPGDEDGVLNYDLKTRKLSTSTCSFERSITATRQLCPYDTIWKAKKGGDASMLPDTISVLNNAGRVAVFRGPKPADPSVSSGRAADLIARVADTHGELPSDWGCNRTFTLQVRPEIERRAREAPGGEPLALLLAVLSEAWWSQGAICHGSLDGADSHGGETDQAALLDAEARGGVRGVAKGSSMQSRIVRPAKSLLKGYQRHLRTTARAAQGLGKENVEMVQVEPATGRV
jgi:hypothetical protein